MPVTVSRRNQGSGGVYTIVGDTLEEVAECASEVKGEIDPWASPSVTHYEAQGKYVAEVKYYGLD
jgi:hypothetical protein